MKNFNISIGENQLIWMFRYCLGRSTYAVTDAVEAIHFNWDVLNPEIKRLIVDEIERYLRDDSFGNVSFQCDNASWESVIERYNNESIKGSNSNGRI